MIHNESLKKDNDHQHSISFCSVSSADINIVFSKSIVCFLQLGLNKSLLGLVTLAVPSVKILFPVLSVS